MSEATQFTPKPKKSVALSGVPAGNTALCTVGRTGNDLHYRGYDILDFAEEAEFEEIAYLLVHGKLPTVAELAAYKRKLKALRGLPASVQASSSASRQTRTPWTCCEPAVPLWVPCFRNTRTTSSPKRATLPTG
jgi:2-methylcitrate synthase